MKLRWELVDVVVFSTALVFYNSYISNFQESYTNIGSERVLS